MRNQHQQQRYVRGFAIITLSMLILAAVLLLYVVDHGALSSLYLVLGLIALWLAVPIVSAYHEQVWDHTIAAWKCAFLSMNQDERRMCLNARKQRGSVPDPRKKFVLLRHVTATLPGAALAFVSTLMLPSGLPVYVQSGVALGAFAFGYLLMWLYLKRV